MTLERHLGMMTLPAHKTILDGIQSVATRLKPAGDDKPRLQIFRDCVVERDRELAQVKQPCSLEEEAEMYTWDTRQGTKKGELPIDAFNHAWDACRYLVARFDLMPHGVSYFKDIWR
jgi:phage terminase large subunit